MGCDFVKLPGGGAAIVCSKGGRGSRTPCKVCGKGRASLLCDGPSSKGRGTCDLPMCSSCAKHVGPDRDLCPKHAAAPEQRGLGL